MAGNVWEWTATQWVFNYYNYTDVVNNSKNGDVTRTVRGGSWGVYNSGVRSTDRSWYGPSYRGRGGGFRVVFAPGS